jgi:glycosyltransferase involved in cell wall biosynthesis
MISRKKRIIAYFSNQFPSPVEPYVVEEIRELRRRGIQVLACSMWRPSEGLLAELVEVGADTHYLFPLHWRSLAKAFLLCVQKRHVLADLFNRILGQGRESCLRRAKALLHTGLGAYFALRLGQQEVEHIHVHHGYFGAWVAMVAARLLHIPFTMTLHGSDLLVHHAFLDTKLQNCAACFTVSNFNREHIRQHFPEIDTGKVILRRLGVEVPKLSISAAWERLPLFTILSVGRLHPVKDHAFLLKACSVLRQLEINFLCLIAGEGPERPRLRRQIARLGLRREVKLLGHVAHPDLEALYPLVDVVVLTSRSEGIPLTLMEAMSYAKPVLAPRITGIPELVRDGETGFLYCPGSLQDFVSRLELIRTAAAALGPLCRAARQQPLFAEEDRTQLSSDEIPARDENSVLQ